MSDSWATTRLIEITRVASDGVEPRDVSSKGIDNRQLSLLASVATQKAPTGCVTRVAS